MKKMMTLATMALVTTSFMAFAQTNDQKASDRQAKMQARFDASDSNRDGKLSYAEIQNSTAHLERMDSNRDGKLSDAEMQNPMHRARFDKADANRDGALTIEEMRQAHQANKNARRERKEQMREKLQRLDANQDQALSRAEIGNEMPKLLENFDIFDGNNDGKITREEMQIARKAMYAEGQSQAK
jgi:Ca2+-binding EF-hand superfamily protein